MPKFEYHFTVKASLERVAAFHHDSRVLKRLTPPPVIVQLHRFDPLREGAVAEFTLWLGPLPFRWVAVHREVDPLRGFTDIQAKGPFKRWVHRHTFVAEGQEQTQVYDTIEYEHYSGLKGWLTRLLFPPPALRVMFTYRKWVTRRRVERS
jgi:ligand-binding SRPBCC domain-containing protein